MHNENAHLMDDASIQILQTTENRIFCSQCGARLPVAGMSCDICAPQTMPAIPDINNAAKSLSIKPSFILYFLILSVYIITTIANSVGELSEVTSEFLSTGWIVLCVIIWGVKYFGLFGESLRHAGKLKWYFWAALAGVVTSLIAELNVGVFNSFLELEPNLYAKPFLDEGYGWWVVILMICVEPAIFEEIAFRGIVLNNLSKSFFTVREAVLISSLMFAILHLNIIGIPFLFICGLGMAFFRIKSGSLYPSMVMHFVHNFMAIMGEYFNWF